MRKLCDKVNLIPVIAKSDTLSEDETAAFKERILRDLDYHGIKIYKAPQYDKEDEETIAENEEIIVSGGGGGPKYLTCRLNAHTFLPRPILTAAQDPFCRRRIQQHRHYPRRTPSQGPLVPMGNHRGRQRGALRLCQASTNAHPYPHGGAQGAHQPRPVREVPLGEAHEHGNHPGPLRLQGSQVGPFVFFLEVSSVITVH